MIQFLIVLVSFSLARDGTNPFGFPMMSPPQQRHMTRGEMVYETLRQYPDNCDYRFTEKVGGAWQYPQDSNSLCKSVNQVSENKEAICAPSNCSTATYHALVETLKLSPLWPAIKSKVDCTPPRGMGSLYTTLIGTNGVLEAFKDFDLGEAMQIERSDLFREEPAGWPAKGDIVLLQRTRAQGGSGHAVTFSHFSNDGRGGKTICYWSSNNRTNGYGEKCEPVSRLDFIQVGRVKEHQRLPGGFIGV